MQKQMIIWMSIIFSATTIFGQKHSWFSNQQNAPFSIQNSPTDLDFHKIFQNRIWNPSGRKNGHLIGLSDKLKLDSTFTYDFDEVSGESITTQKSYETFDENGNLIIHIDYSFDKATSQIKFGNKIIYSHNTNDQLMYESFYRWDRLLSTWAFQFQNKYEYDGQDRIITETSYNANSDDYELFPIAKRGTIYDEHGNIITITSYKWNYNSASWINYSKSEYTYNNLNQLITLIQSSWNSETNSWINVFKSASTYNTNNQLINQLEMSWNESVMDWENEQMSNLESDSNDNFISQDILFWDVETNNWYNFVRFELTYDELKNLVLTDEKYWDDEINDWTVGYKTEFIYDNGYSFDLLILPAVNPLMFRHKLESITESSWDEETASWKKEEAIHYYYSALTMTSVQADKEHYAKVFPNPVVDKLSLYLSPENLPKTLELFDLQGIKVMTRYIKDDASIDFSSLEPGVYFYHLYDQNKKQSGKLVKL